MKSFILVFFIAFSLNANSQIELALSVDESQDEPTSTSYGLIDIGTKFRRVEVGGYVYYLPGVWEPLPEIEPHYCFGKRPCLLEELKCDSLTKELSILASHRDSIERINQALWFTLMQKQSEQKEIARDTINKTHLYILFFLTILWLIYPIINEKVNSSSDAAYIG